MTPQVANARVQINQIDYTVQPSGTLDNSGLPRVPVIRIYGVSSTGKKTCVHIHQVYPYFFLEYAGNMDPKEVNKYIARLTLSINHAIAISLRRNPSSPNSQFVRAIILVKGVHFYGFHSSYSPFLKVLFADPSVVKRAITLLQAGAIMKTRFRICESHLSFLLQFMSDFGLYGCGWIELAEVWQRDVQEQDEQEGQDRESGISSSSSSDLSSLPSPYHRQTRMPLELDVAAHQILNRHRLSARNIHHKLDIPAPELPQEPVVLSVRELWDDERQRRVARGLSPSPVLPKDPSENSRDHGGGWAAEVRWWDEVRERIERERSQEPDKPPGAAWERWVMSTFESVEALWEPEYKTWKPEITEDNRDKAIPSSAESVDNPYGSITQDGLTSQGQIASTSREESDIEVDEVMLLSQEMSRIVDKEEIEWAVREGEVPEADNREITEEPPLPEPQEDEATPQASPSKMTPSKAAQREAYQRALQKIVGSIHPPSDSSSRSTSITPKQRNPLSVLSKTPTRSDGTSTRAFPLAPMLDARENPFLEDRLPELLGGASNANGPILDTSPDNPFLDDSMKASSNDESSTILVSPDYHLQTPPFRAAAKSSLSYTRSLTPRANNTSRRVEEQLDDRPSKRRKTDAALSEASHPTSTFSSATKPTQFPRAKVSYADTTSYEYARPPPSTAGLLASLDAFAIPAKIYQVPYYSIESDAPERPREYAGLVYNLKGGTGIANLEEWKSSSEVVSTPWNSANLSNANVYGWEYASTPPSVRQAKKWLTENKMGCQTNKPKKSSQITGPTQANPYGLNSGGSIVHGSTRQNGGMTILSLETFAPSRGKHLPDPGTDEIVAVFYSFYDYTDQREDHSEHFRCKAGIVAIRDEYLQSSRLRDWVIDPVDTELDLINRFTDIVWELDPDIVTGWEVQGASWGFLAARAGSYGLDIGEQISRAPGRHVVPGSDQWGLQTTSTFQVVGRHVLNLWRVMRSEGSLPNYTFENVVFDTLRRRTPKYSSASLTEWYRSDVPDHTSRLFRYFSTRASMVLEIIEVAEIVTKTSEFARVFGVDFFSVISRGSQFKVESFMSRIAKPESFVLLSPSKEDVGKQNAAECMPLIMEPLSAFYSSPLLVLDFQSLYPSIMIAYNYCYSTCLGRAVDFKGQNKFGVTELHQPVGLLETLQEHLNVSPNGMIFVKPSVRKGLLGRMLTELLDTRVMVKQAMKDNKGDKSLQRVLDARQLAMKFIANVTYGYTSATYSGRMPAVEIADAIVQSGRETLEKAIRVIDSTKKWGAKVVYGDTDSLFIYLPGKTKDQAFRIGYDISDTITKMNPAPIKLKFEKVYLPCVLMAKKRYVGFKYETPDDKEPVFDAKGIETVRRDGVLAQRKMTEKCLKILFRSQDLSKVKDYCCTTWAQILENRASIQDFIFAKEVRMGTYSDKGPPPPGVAVAARRMAEDPNDEPQYGDRIPYVITRGSPGMRLVDRAAPPEEVLNDPHKHIDAVYYISRVLIPPLERIFNLLGADVRGWYDEMPKAQRADAPEAAAAILASPRKASREAALITRYKIDEHFYTSHCVACGASSSDLLCDTCRWQPVETIARLGARLNRTERRLTDVQLICASCSQVAATEPIRCESLDCPRLYERKKVENKAESLQLLRDIIDDLEADIAEDTGILVEDEAPAEMVFYDQEDENIVEVGDDDDELEYEDPSEVL